MATERQGSNREILLDFLKDKFKNIPLQYQQKIEQAERSSILNFLR